MSDLEQLKKLILGSDRERMQRLDERISDLEQRAADVAEVLPQAVDKIVDDPEFQSSMDPTVTRALRGAVRRDTAEFAEVLFPVMGPAIRRAVSDALKSLVQRINLAMEYNLSPKGLRWRLEAMRSGVPYAQIVLRNTMLYTVQEAFLIHRESGLVVEHVSRDPLLALDEDAVGAMLSAIQSFIQDSLGADEPLRSAELGSYTLWVVNGPAAVLACVISGTPPRELRDELMELLESLHARYGGLILGFDGAPVENQELANSLERALQEEQIHREEKSSGPGLMWWLAGLALLAVLLYWAYQNYADRRYAASVERALSNTSGIVVTDLDWRDDKLLVNGLRDPDAPNVEAVIAQAGIDQSKLQTELRAYHSLEADLVLSRFARRFAIPDQQLRWTSAGQLKVEQAVNAELQQQMLTFVSLQPGINGLEFAEVQLNAEQIRRYIGDRLGQPQGVELAINGDQVVLSGNVPIDWYKQARQLSLPAPWRWSLEEALNQYQRDYGEQLAVLSGYDILFALGATDLSPSDVEGLRRWSSGLQSLLQLSELLDKQLGLRITGFADAAGSAALNHQLSLQRAQQVNQQLASFGVTLDATINAEVMTTLVSPSARRAVITLIEQ